LNAVDSAYTARNTYLSRKSGNPVQSHCRPSTAFMSQLHLDSVWVTHKGHCQVRVVPDQVLKRFLASSDNGLL